MTIDDILILYGNGSAPTQVAKNDYLAKCPICNGDLHIKKKRGVIALLCGGNCTTVDVLRVHKLTLADLKLSKNGHGAATATPPQAPPPSSPPPALQQTSTPGRPPKRLIDTRVRDLPLINAECWRAIEEQNDPPALFTHGSEMIRIRYDYKDDSAIIEDVDPYILRHELSNWADWIGKKARTCDPPMWAVRDIIASRVVPLPRFSRIVSVPVFAPDGTLQTTPGYSEASGVIYAPIRGYRSLAIPDQITPAHVDDAKKLIEELITDFPFACDDAGDSPDHDNAVSMLLSPFVRDMINAPTPLHLVEASMPGSGKGLLTQALFLPAFGPELRGNALPDDDDEIRKILTSALMAGKSLIWFDNVNHAITSPVLAGALTMNAWDDRKLGSNTLANVKIRTTWAVCANNVTTSTEIARRIVRVRLAPQTDKPEERTGFVHDDLLGWAEGNRPELVWAAHVLCKNAIQAGLPKAKSKVIGSYDRWSRLLGSILECAGYNHFLKNFRVILDGSDAERLALSLFAISWHEWMEGENARRQAASQPMKYTATTAELQPIAEGVDGINLRGNTDKAKQTSLGKWLMNKHEVVTEYADDDPSNPIAVYRFRILFAGMGKGKDRGSKAWRIELLETVEK